MRRSRLALAAGVTAFTVGVVVNAWSGQALTLHDFLAYAIVGVATGSILAVAASGLVVTYTTSGVFNFAHGAIGMAMAFLYWELRVNRGWPTPIALVAVLGVVAPLFGVAVERLFVRRLKGAPLVNQLVVTIGLMLGLMGAVPIIWKPGGRNLEPFFGTAGFHAPGGVFVTWHRVITVAAAVAVAVILRLLLFRTRIGVTMRAVVDNEDLAGLSGARPARASAMSWALGASLAALAGILIAPEVGLNVSQLTLLIIDAFAAAVVGRLRNLPLTYVGGLAIGLLSSFAIGYLDLAGRWNNARQAIPTIFLFVVLLAMPEARVRLGTALRVRAPRIPSARQTVWRMVALIAVVGVVSLFLSEVNVNRLTLGMLTALIMLSLVPLTGWSGQISLAQMTFAGVGAFAMAKVTGGDGSPVGLLAAAGLAAVFGLVASIPALRLRGLYLALATMAFALAMELLFFPQPEVFAGRAGGTQVNLQRLSLFGYRFESARSYLMLVTVCFALTAVLLLYLRRGSFGRRLIALRESPAACATMGVNLLATKVSVFALSAALAGFAGALLGMFRVVVTASDFTMFNSLPILVLAVVGGISTVGGALFGGVFTIFFTVVHDVFHWSILSTLEVLGPGMVAIGLGRNPTGVVPDVAIETREQIQALEEPDVGEMGLVRSFDTDELRVVDRRLELPDEARARPGRADSTGAEPTRGGPVAAARR